MHLCFGNVDPVLQGYTDTYYVDDTDSMKSTSRYLVTFCRGEVSWKSKPQKCISLSTTEAEYIVVVEACKEVLWMKNFLQELGHKRSTIYFVTTKVPFILPIIQVIQRI